MQKMKSTSASHRHLKDIVSMQESEIESLEKNNQNLGMILSMVVIIMVILLLICIYVSTSDLNDSKLKIWLNENCECVKMKICTDYNIYCKTYCQIYKCEVNTDELARTK